MRISTAVWISWLCLCIVLFAGCEAVRVGELQPAGVGYRITDLGTIEARRRSSAYGINEKGQVVGYGYAGSNIWHAWLWESGSGMRDLGTLGGSSSEAYAINEAGQVVGGADLDFDRPHSCSVFVWEDGEMTELVSYEGPTSKAYAVNNAGQVVGESGGQAFMWDKRGGLRRLKKAGWYNSLARGINEAGEIVGSAYISGAGWHAWLRKTDGEIIRLGTLGSDSWAHAINNVGQVVGWSEIEGEGIHAFIWDETDGMRDLGTFGGEETYARAINDAGQVVGYSKTTIGKKHAFIWDSDNGLRELSDLLGSGSGWNYLEYADGINNAGQIVGEGEIANRQSHAYLLTPVRR